MAGLTVVSPPQSEPVTAEEAMDQCRTDQGEDRGTVAALIVGARQLVESWTGRLLVTQTVTLTLDWFYEEGCCRDEGFSDVSILLDGPVQSLTAAVYDDADGDEQTLTEGTDFALDAAGNVPRLVPAVGSVWPTVSGAANAVRITYVAGYGAPAAVPQALKQAILLLVAHWFLNREAAGAPMAEQPMGVQALCLAFWTGRYR